MIGLFVFLAGLNGFALVAFAAYSAHGGGGAGLPDPAMFGIAWQIHAVHTCVMVALGMCRRPNIWLFAAYWLILAGTFFFSGSLYGLGLGWWLNSSIITPFGGLMMIAGWFCLIISGLYRLSYTARSHKLDE